jgi:hypothetical protein
LEVEPTRRVRDGAEVLNPTILNSPQEVLLSNLTQPIYRRYPILFHHGGHVSKAIKFYDLFLLFSLAPQHHSLGRS